MRFASVRVSAHSVSARCGRQGRERRFKLEEQVETISGAAQTPTYWTILTVALSLLVPAGFVLVGVAGLPRERAWRAALAGLSAIGLGALAYWAFGFALQFGGIGLAYPKPELTNLVWEWSPLNTQWGSGWGAAGLSGWFLSGNGMTALAYALFVSHLPWAIMTAIIPLIALRGRAPTVATLILAVLIGGVIYPLAGNWVQGGGWLAALGKNLNLGHGFVDFAGAGSVHLVAAGISLAALVVWIPRPEAKPATAAELAPAQLPLLAVLGSLLIPAGILGWQWANPLQTELIGNLGLLRGTANVLLYAAAGSLTPLLYTWFVTGSSDPVLTARGIAAGAVAGLAAGPFVEPWAAVFIGLLAGATVPFVTYLLDTVLPLDDGTGSIIVSGLPAIVGLLLVGFLADGSVGRGWNVTGADSFMGVSGQGVSGLFTASAFQRDFPGQLQAQLIGVLALVLWGFIAGYIVCAPLGMIIHGITRDDQASVSSERSTGTSKQRFRPVPSVRSEYQGAFGSEAPADAVLPPASAQETQDQS